MQRQAAPWHSACRSVRGLQGSLAGMEGHAHFAHYDAQASQLQEVAHAPDNSDYSDRVRYIGIELRVDATYGHRTVSIMR